MQTQCRECAAVVTPPNQWGEWFNSPGWLHEELCQTAGLCEGCARAKLSSVDRLGVIRQRLAEATQGRWVWTSQYSRHPVLVATAFGRPVVLAAGLDEEGYERLPAGHALIQARVEKPSRLVPLTSDHPDAKLIADAPMLLRWAVEEIEKLRKENEARP